MAPKKPTKSENAETDQFFEDGDDSLSINMDDIEAQSFENIPKGTYQGIIEECEFKMSASSGKPMWAITLVITDGEYNGRKLFSNMSFSEKALPMTKATLMAIKPEVLSSAFNPKKIAEEGTLVGTKVSIKTVIEAYNGEDRTRVKTLQAPKGENDDFAIS